MQTLAAIACRPEASRGRLHAEPGSATRTAFQRDRDRVIHCGAFRRLQYKTQVFIYHEGDYYRTRLTHSLEVAQIARSICRHLGLNEDLAEAVALAHDLGHTPFGHAGETALSAVMQPFGGFDHNEQSFRILTELEHRYATFDGLNLTWECLEGLVKHNGPLSDPRPSLVAYKARQDLEFSSHPSAEAQVAALSDDIAYNNHDIADGLRAGILQEEDLAELPMVGAVFEEVHRLYPDLEPGRFHYEAFRRLMTAMVNDLLEETQRRIAEAKPETPDAVRALEKPLVGFSEAVGQAQLAIKRYLFQRLYRDYRVNRMMVKADRVVRELFTYYLEAPRCLPDDWRVRAETAGDEAATARLIADYIAGMTDRYALAEHAKLFDLYQRM
ncbi:MAG: deoxyguanosinetriphosphate triphosphohydrolase [Pseudomonadota bacterium]